MRTAHLICMLAALVIVGSLVLISQSGKVTASSGLVPIPQMVPLSMEQQRAHYQPERFEAEMRKEIKRLNEAITKLNEAITKLNNRVTAFNKEYRGLSDAKLEEMQWMQTKINELDNRIPPAHREPSPSDRRRGLFNK